MRSGRRTLNWNTPMPVHPVRQRHEPPKRGDNKRAIIRAKDRNLDGNLSIMAGHVWFAHWTTPGRNGYTYVIDAHTRRRRRMTRAELRRPGDQWGVDGIRRWRRRNGEHPLTHEEGIAYAVAHRAVCVQELKSPDFGVGTWAEQMVATCKRYDHPAWFKTLPSMRGAEAKVAKVRAAGGQIALIYGSSIRGRLRRLSATRRVSAGWPVKPDRTW